MAASDARTAQMGELLRFGVVGVGQNAVNLGAFAALLAVGVPYLGAAVLSGALALLLSFLANRHWTFEGARSRRAVGQATSYGLVFLAASLWGLGVLALCTEVIGVREVIGQAIALVSTAPLSYLAQRQLTFRAARLTTRARGR